MAQGLRKPDVDERMVKLLVGLIAIALPILVAWTSWPEKLGSISAAYWVPAWPQTLFIGFLFAIAGFLLSYDGRSTAERVASRIAAISALLIALYPCECKGHEEIIKGVHYWAATVMYLVLAFFCWKFRLRAKDKPWVQARARAIVYAVCGVALVVAIAFLAVNAVMHNALAQRYETFVFFWESVGLFAFGFSWLTASHSLPFLNTRAELFNPVTLQNQPPVDTAGTSR
jgi:hypothetical protein